MCTTWEDFQYACGAVFLDLHIDDKNKDLYVSEMLLLGKLSMSIIYGNSLANYLKTNADQYWILSAMHIMSI